MLLGLSCWLISGVQICPMQLPIKAGPSPRGPVQQQQQQPVQFAEKKFLDRWLHQDRGNVSTHEQGVSAAKGLPAWRDIWISAVVTPCLKRRHIKIPNKSRGREGGGDHLARSPLKRAREREREFFEWLRLFARFLLSFSLSFSFSVCVLVWLDRIRLAYFSFLSVFAFSFLALILFFSKRVIKQKIYSTGNTKRVSIRRNNRHCGHNN